MIGFEVLGLRFGVCFGLFVVRFVLNVVIVGLMGVSCDVGFVLVVW